MKWIEMVNAGLAVFWAVVLIANAVLLVLWIREERYQTRKSERETRNGTSPRPSPQGGEGEALTAEAERRGEGRQ